MTENEILLRINTLDADIKKHEEFVQSLQNNLQQVTSALHQLFGAKQEALRFLEEAKKVNQGAAAANEVIADVVTPA